MSPVIPSDAMSSPEQGRNRQSTSQSENPPQQSGHQTSDASSGNIENSFVGHFFGPQSSGETQDEPGVGDSSEESTEDGSTDDASTGDR